MYDYLTVATAKKPARELDAELWHSPEHPQPDALPQIPVNLRAAWAGRSQQARGAAPPAQTAMQVLEFYDFLKEHRARLTTENDLWEEAERLDRSGHRRLMHFLLSRKDLPLLLEKISTAERAPAEAARQRATRMRLVEEAVASRPCICSSHGFPPGRWKAAAEEATQLNGYRQQEFEVAILEALELGREKQRNIFVVGDTNRAKSFCMKPMTLLFKTFVPPDTGTHQLADIRGAEIIWLNDFTYDPVFLAPKPFKNFLEGEPVKVGVPKNEGKNYIYDLDSPVFGTGPGPVEHPRLEHETRQFTSRMRYFVFRHFFNPESCPRIPPCVRCWAEWVLAAQARPRSPPGPPPAGLFEEFSRRAREQAARGRGGAAALAARGSQPWVVVRPRVSMSLQISPAGVSVVALATTTWPSARVKLQASPRLGW